MIKHAWQGYREHAWGLDELCPITKVGANWNTEDVTFNRSLAITMVDSLDTLLIAGFEAEFRESVEYIRHLEWDKDITVSVFETIIRNVGGLLSAYALSGEHVLLLKARELVDRLGNAFDPDWLPWPFINLRRYSGSVTWIAGKLNLSKWNAGTRGMDRWESAPR